MISNVNCPSTVILMLQSRPTQGKESKAVAHIPRETMWICIKTNLELYCISK